MMANHRTPLISAVALTHDSLCDIVFGLLLKNALGSFKEAIYIHTRSDDRLVNTALPRAKTNAREVPIIEVLFPDDAAVVAHT